MVVVGFVDGLLTIHSTIKVYKKLIKVAYSMVIENATEKPKDYLSEAKKICLNFQSQDRKVRKQSYVDLQLFLSVNTELTDQQLRIFFCETHMYFINGLRDRSEAVREQAIKFIAFLLTELLPINDFYLTYIFPVIVERIGTVELIEESEEIRLQMLQLLESIIIKYSNTPQLKPFLSDSVIILHECVKDKHPAIKELGCRTIVKLAKSLPRDFHMQAESLVKPVVTCFTHQRYKVRVEAVKAIGEIIMHSTYKGLDEALIPMAEKLFDQIPLVRQTVAQEAARWLLHHRDRYSFFYKMLPLLLTGLNDEVEETRVEAHQLWEKVGLQYEEENEKDLKDKLDFLTEMPKHYPKHLKRPNLGCRVLVQKNVTRIASGIANELTSWQADVRVRCSQLLCCICLHSEEDITLSLQNLLLPMYSAARDDDSRVVSNIIQASELIGLFVEFDTWSILVFPVIEDGPHYGHLTVLAGLVNGAPTENISKEIGNITKLLVEDYICFSRKEKYQLAMLNLTQILMNKYDSTAVGSTNEAVPYNFFKLLTSLIALKNPNVPDEKIGSFLYDDLSKILNLQNKTQVFYKFMNPLLMEINKSPESWTPVSENFCIFLTLLAESEKAISTNLDAIGNILEKILDTEMDAQLRLKVFYVLATIFDTKANFSKAENVSNFMEKLVVDVFIPSLVWHAGATAESIRTMACSCLKYALIPSGDTDLFTSSEILQNLMQKLVPLLLSLVEDASYRSRQAAIECLALLKENCEKKAVWWNEDLIKIYPEILKRLDDPTEKVRVTALICLPIFFSNVPAEFTQPHFKAHRELIIDTLLTHFDDDDKNIQQLVLDVLKTLAKIEKCELLKKVELHRSLLRNQEGCDALVSFCNDLS